MRLAICENRQKSVTKAVIVGGRSYLPEPFGLGMLLKTESWEMNSGAEDSRFGEDTDAPNPVDFHFHVRIAVGISEVCQMWPPGGIFGISFYNNSVFVQSVC